MRTHTLTLPPGPIDHYGAIEAKRIEMIQEAQGKIDALKARVADLRQQAQAKRAERIKLGEAGDYNHMIRLQTDADGLDREARRLLNLELPQLEHDRAHIDSHPTLVAMRISADARTAADKPAPKNLPTFVVLDAAFGWTHESRPTVFAKGQIVRDPAHIAKLLELNAPLVR
jgi:hypothetical protein